jgi:hypothetical protein
LRVAQEIRKSDLPVEIYDLVPELALSVEQTSISCNATAGESRTHSLHRVGEVWTSADPHLQPFPDKLWLSAVESYQRQSGQRVGRPRRSCPSCGSFTLRSTVIAMNSSVELTLNDVVGRAEFNQNLIDR